jgi:poly(A) polymerase
MAVIDPPERPGLARLCEVLDARDGQTRLVGGVVRDTLAAQVVKDIDLATRLSPQVVIDRLEAARFKAVPTGLAHGTVTAVLDSGPIEITTLRRDVSTDGRRATVSFTDDWEEDAARRDFTINALYADPQSGEVFDYFGGEADLRAGIVRFIGEPLQRIAEDHLRILRFFRFHARFGTGRPDPASLEACVSRANDLMALSRERIADELLKLLALPEAGPTVALMIERGIIRPVIPEIKDAGTMSAFNRASLDPVQRLAALLPPDPVSAEGVAGRLRLSKAMTRRLVLAAGREPADTVDPRGLAYRLGLEAARDRLTLAGATEALSKLDGWTPPRFPLTGGSIVARGIVAGPAVARILKSVETRWIAEGFPDAARVEKLADEATEKARREG